jgi:hypothetical protein
MLQKLLFAETHYCPRPDYASMFGSYYRLSHGKKDWTAANTDCLSDGGNLPIFKTAPQLKALKFIGGRCNRDLKRKNFE